MTVGIFSHLTPIDNRRCRCELVTNSRRRLRGLVHLTRIHKHARQHTKNTYMDAQLCLTCSSSLPTKSMHELFITACCSRAICDDCLRKNSRLKAYNPCLMCLGGVDASSQSRKHISTDGINGNGLTGLEVRGIPERDMFVLGDSSDEDEDLDDHQAIDGIPPISSSATLPPPYATHHASTSESLLPTSPPSEVASSSPNYSATDNQRATDSAKYYIRPGDTLTAISLRFGTDVSINCIRSTT